jgi:hypothetical protein
MSKSKKRKRQLEAAKTRDSSAGRANQRASDNSLRKAVGGKSRARHKDRDRLIAMVLASLAAGFLGVVNADRVTHVNAQSTPGNSKHGWPLVYLFRELEEPPMFVIESEVYSWPWPAVDGEIREFNAMNLVGNLLLIACIAVGTYWGIKTIVGHYDQWRYDNEAS